MPPRYLKRKYPTRLKPCQERTVAACDTVPTDGCCGVIPCKLCLEWQVYGEVSQYGSAEFADSSWTGTVDGMSFVAYWERNYDDECEFVVELDGEEVYRANCYEGASCRSPGGEADVSTEYIEGTLVWSTFEPRELQVVVDPDTGCRDFFCGDCRCSCECLCVNITEYGGDVVTLSGELCDVAYACDPPTWEGTIGYYELSLTLGRDQYGQCIITPTVDGVELEPVEAPGCGSMTATFTDEAGNIFEVTCKECSCDVPCPCPCCPDCWSRVQSAVGGVLIAIAGEGGTDCGKPPGEGEGYEQEITFSCTDLNDETNNVYYVFVSLSMSVKLFCDRESENWKAQYKSDATGQVWTDTDVTFTCPSCAGVESGGLVTGTFSFVAYDECETSGGPVAFPWNITIEITVECS